MKKAFVFGFLKALCRPNQTPAGMETFPVAPCELDVTKTFQV